MYDKYEAIISADRNSRRGWKVGFQVLVPWFLAFRVLRYKELGRALMRWSSCQINIKFMEIVSSSRDMSVSKLQNQCHMEACAGLLVRLRRDGTNMIYRQNESKIEEEQASFRASSFYVPYQYAPKVEREEEHIEFARLRDHLGRKSVFIEIS